MVKLRIWSQCFENIVMKNINRPSLWFPRLVLVLLLQLCHAYDMQAAVPARRQQHRRPRQQEQQRRQIFEAVNRDAATVAVVSRWNALWRRDWFWRRERERDRKWASQRESAHACLCARVRATRNRWCSSSVSTGCLVAARLGSAWHDNEPIVSSVTFFLLSHVNVNVSGALVGNFHQSAISSTDDHDAAR